MSQANPLEVSGSGIVLPMLESLQCQITAAQKLLILLRAHGDETVSAAVEEHLVHLETLLRKAVSCLNTPPSINLGGVTNDSVDGSLTISGPAEDWSLSYIA